MFDVGCWMFNVGCSMSDIGYAMSEVLSETLKPETHKHYINN